MGCQSEVTIGDNLTFSICAHDPGTGVLTDTDSAPTYRVYEDETGASLLDGTMTKLDDANTTGFYTEQIACTLANGFEVGKSYTIYIEGIVGADKGGICFGFLARSLVDAVWDEMMSGHSAAGSAGHMLQDIEEDVDSAMRRRRL